MASKLYKQFKADTYSGESTIYKQFQEDLRYGSNTGNADVDLYIALRRKQEADREVKQQKKVSRINQERQNRVVQNATLNQQRAATTDFLRTERENLAKTPERTFGTAFKMQMDLGSQNQRKTTAEKRQKDYREKHGQDVDGSYIRYDQIQNQPDYAQNVEAGKQAKNIFNSQPESILDYLDKDVRVNERVRANDSYGYMNETEKNLYRYLVGKYGAESGAKYVESIRAELNQRAADKKSGDLTEYARENPSAALGDYVHSTLTGYANAPVALAKQLYNNVVKDGESLDPNDPSFQSEYEKTAIREGLKNSDGLKNIIPNEGIRNFAVDTGLSMGENLLRLPMGRMSLAAAGIGAGASGMRDALERGATGKEAMAVGIAQGGAESFFEKFSLDNLKAFKTMTPKSTRELFKNILKQSVTEGSEEMATELTNSFSDLAIMQELSQMSADYRQAKAEGQSKTSAVVSAGWELMKRIGLAGAGGAVSGGIMGGGAQALGIAEQEMQYRDIGRQVNPDYRDYSEGIDTDVESYEDSEDYAKAVQLQQLAQEYADRQKQGEFISNRNKGRFEVEVDDFVSKLNNRQNDQQSKEVIENQDQNITGVTEPESLEQPKVRENQQRETFDHPSYEPVISEPEQVEMSQNQPFDIKAQESLSEPQKRQETANLSPELVENGESQEHLGEQFGRNGKNAFVDNFSDDMDLPAYTRAFGRAYDAGRYDVPMDVAEHSAIMSVLGSEQMENAFKAGAQDRQLYSRVQGHQLTGFKQGDAKTGNLTLETGDAAESHIKVAERVGKLTGLNVVLVNNQNRDQITAAYGKGRIMLDVSEENFMGSVSHELTHFIQDYSPDLYDLYRSTAVEALMKSRKESLDQMIEAYGNSYAGAGQNLSRDQIMDEIVADATQSFLNDETFIRDAVKQDKGLGERIIDFLTDVIDAIKELIHQGSDRKAARALEENVEYLERARKYWMSALEDAGDRYRSGLELENQDTADKYSLAKPDQVTKEKLEENYDFVRNMEPVVTLAGDEFEGQRGVKTLTEAVMEYYNSLGNQVHNDVVGDILLSRRSVKDDIAHGYNDVKAITFKAVPELLEKGKILQFNKDWKARGYDTAVIGGKIEIAEGEHAGDYYQICVVKVDVNQNRMYLHEVQVIKTDGNIPFKTWTVDENGLPSGYAPPIYSIFDKLMGVNEKSAKHGIRYQLRDVDNSYMANDVETLIQENKELKEANELLKKQFELTGAKEAMPEDIRSISEHILEKYSSSYKVDGLEENIQKLYHYIWTSQGKIDTDVHEAAVVLAKSVLKKSKRVDAELVGQYKGLKKQLKETRITIAEHDRADLESEGGYDAFRRANRGKLNLGDDGIQVDSIYLELSEQYPELFDKDITHPADQLIEIAEALDFISIQVKNPYHANMDEMSYIVANEIIQAYADLQLPTPTFADVKNKEVEKVKLQYNQKIRRYKQRLDEQFKARKRELDQKYYVRRGELERNAASVIMTASTAYQQRVTEQNIELEAMRGKYRDDLKTVRDQHQGRHDKRIIIKEVRNLRRWLLEPQKDHYIPEDLRVTIADFLKHIDFSSNRLNKDGELTERSKAWDKAKREFEAIIQSGGKIEHGKDKDKKSTVYLDIDPDLAIKIDKLKDKVVYIDKLDNLDPYSLSQLKEVVYAVKSAIYESNKTRSMKKNEEITDFASGMMRDLVPLKDKKNRLILKAPDQLLNIEMLDPMTMFGMMGSHGTQLYRALRDGLDRKTRMLQETDDYVENVKHRLSITGDELRGWDSGTDAVKEFKLTGGTIRLTVTQIMELYELSKRTQAKEHLYNRIGGVKIRDITVGFAFRKDGVKMPKLLHQDKPLRLTEADVRKMTDILTDKQKAFADALQIYLEKNCGRKGNEISRMMYGYEKFHTRHYYPISTDSNHIAVDDDSKGERTIEHMGVTKSVVKNASNPIMIGSILDTFAHHTDRMSSYYGYVPALSDLRKVLNFKDYAGDFDGSSIYEELSRVFGSSGKTYLDRLIKDINGSIDNDRSITERMISNMKAASVAGNLRVAIQQPTSYVRAAAEIDMKYLTQGMATRGRNDIWNTICTYAPIAQWKEWGFYQMQTSRQLKDVLFDTDNQTQRFTNWSMGLASYGDKVTWCRLWKACEYECQDLHPELTQGSDEYYHAVALRFNEVVDKTQVVDSVLHRTQIMRSNNAINKMATDFMGEPLKNYNMLYRAAMEFNNREKGKNYKEFLRDNKTGQKKALRVAAAYVAQNTLTALAAAVIDTMRDEERDKSMIEKYQAHVFENWKSGMNLIYSIPVAKDAVSIFQGFKVVRTDMSLVQDLAYAWNEVYKLHNGKSNRTPQWVLQNSIRAVSKLFGLPVNSICRDTAAILDTAINAYGGAADYQWMKQQYDIQSKDNLAIYADMIIEANQSGNKELQSKIMKELNTAGFSNEDIAKKIKSQVKQELVTDKTVHPDIDQAASAKLKLDLDTYERLVIKLQDEGYDQELILGAIKTRVGQLDKAEAEEEDEEVPADEETENLFDGVFTTDTSKSKDEESESYYTGADLVRAIEQFDNTQKSLKAFERMAKNIVDKKVASGKTKKKSIEELKSSITRQYKEMWMSGDSKVRAQIQNKLKYLKVDNQALYSSADWSKWLEDAKEKEK